MAKIKFKKMGFDGKKPTIDEINMRQAVDGATDEIQTKLFEVAKEVAESQLGAPDSLSLQELLKLLDDNHININVNVVSMDGKYFATFTVAVIYDVLEL